MNDFGEYVDKYKKTSDEEFDDWFKKSFKK